MEISIVTVNRVFKTYQGQARIAELNSKNPVKRVQGQRDRVSISSEARAALSAQANKESSKPETQKVAAEGFQPMEFEAEKNEETEPVVIAG
jgi:hypothetical protein